MKYESVAIMVIYGRKTLHRCDKFNVPLVSMLVEAMCPRKENSQSF
jgi:hypothetical protein